MHTASPSSISWWRVLLAAGAATALAVFLDLMPMTALAQTSSCHVPDFDPEVLVGTTPTRMPQLCSRAGLELQNLGPNPIYCVASSNSAYARVGRARRVDASGGLWPMNVKELQAVWCITTVAQVAGAGTIMTEVR